jgi:hypothetical protein
MAMSLVYGRIAAQEIEIFFSFHIINMHAFTFFEHNRKRVIVVGAVSFFKRDIILRIGVSDSHKKTWFNYSGEKRGER